MTPEEYREFEKRTRALDDAGLRRLTVLESSQYRPEVVTIARDELARRRLSVLSPEDYWKQFPAEWMAALGFCYRCWSETTDESPGLMVTFDLVGTRLLGRDEGCVECGSVVQSKWFCVIVPIVRLGRYRVIRLERRGYVGRKVKDPRT